ncbi:hypothetical protein [Alteromonas sp. a30]|uniref:hypothetical protein n=1 Tax=Alteromonas sp. a30 TaxID=2730917 RepID=UPI00228239C4|nr:hypothetical protein [Alteromonas sp. a30]MCY7297171.1 hypothetical protein [Alteromonas sp. a30]
MKKYFSFPFLFYVLSFSAFAQNSDIPLNIHDYFNSGISKTLPAIYIWDASKEATYSHSGAGFNIDNVALSKEKPNKGFSFLEKLVKSGKKWNQESKTLVFVKFDKSVVNCEPCNITQDYLNSLPENKASEYHIVTVSVSK